MLDVVLPLALICSKVVTTFKQIDDEIEKQQSIDQFCKDV